MRLLINKGNSKDTNIGSEIKNTKNYNSVDEIDDASLSSSPVKETMAELEYKFDPYYDAVSKVKGEVPYKGANRCTNCGRCVSVCPNNARKLDFPNMSVDRQLCRNCGMCVSVCTTGALTATFAK